MPRPGITCDQVFDAADTLAAECIQPTIKLVRDRIGGSYSTITPHLAAWKEERGGGSFANIPDMPASVSAASRQIWTTSWNAAQETIQTEREGLTAARKEMEREREDMAREITDLETKLELGALGFWGFIATVVVASIWYGIREREAQHETLRRMIESGQPLDQALMDKLLGPVPS